MGSNVSLKTAPQLWLVPGGATSADSARPASPIEDDELLAALRKGETSAGGPFYDRVRPQVDRTLCRLLGHRDSDYEDIAQLAMIELISTIRNFRGECSLDTWASTVTAHVVFKHLRRRQTERRIFENLASPDDPPAVRTNRTGREVMARSAVARVVRHLGKLDVNRAWTFVLHDVLGYELREIAQITGSSVSAEQTRLVRGRRELHERVAEDPELAHVLDEIEEYR
jgi:RNA polymerase sigma-70 factor (ECF subfamily)